MDQQTITIINRVLPILLLLFIGYWFRRHNILSESAMDGLRKLVITLFILFFIFNPT